MARTKASLGVGVRFSDYLSASLLARAFPADAVQACLAQHSRQTLRHRKFETTACVYYCMALSLYPEAATEDVFSALSQGLAWADGSQPAPSLAKSGISARRSRIGWEPLRDLMNSHCLPLANAQAHPDAFYNGLRLVALDGSNFELPDEKANVQAFGRPGSRTGHSGYPQAQCAVLSECGSHAVLGANIGPYRAVEWELCEPLLGKLNSTMLCLADRGFRGFDRWVKACATGAQLLWRTSAEQSFSMIKQLADGSYLAYHAPSTGRRDERRAKAVIVRVIDYALSDAAAKEAQRPELSGKYRLITTLLDPASAPAQDLAALYHMRWHAEAVFDELKTHLRDSRRTLRSKTPDLVRQEFYGWVLAHYAVRWLMHQVANAHDKQHAELSFRRHVQLLKREQPRSGDFSPSASATKEVLV